MKKSTKEIIKKIERLDPLTDAEKMEYILYSITEHEECGKLESFNSISTSALCNKNCSRRAQNKDCICSSCYARKQLKRYKTSAVKMECNTKFYTNYKLECNCIPFINNTVFRFESFGEIQNGIQLENYFTIARKNPHCFFVLWSKEYRKFEEYIPGIADSKPDNLRIIASEYFINNPFNESIIKKYPFIDKVFSVITAEYAAENNIDINCMKKCNLCMTCYVKINDIKFINELKK